MSRKVEATQDFDRAVAKAFWRKIITWIKGDSNELLPFDEVRERLPIRGQHYRGYQEVPIDQIVGSSGRFRDFDRAFFPTQTQTKDRWISIDTAHLDQIDLPPVELYKMGDIYFVKDGNHRVSVAREIGQRIIDAYVVEIDIPIPLTTDTRIDDLEIKQEYAKFIERTKLTDLYPDAQFETHIPGQYAQLLAHIDDHRWYLGEQLGDDVPYAEAVTSWYEEVYMPLVEALHEGDILNDFPEVNEIDLFIWVMKYQVYLRDAYSLLENVGIDEQVSREITGSVKKKARKKIADQHPQPSVKKLIRAMQKAGWVEDLILDHERAVFFNRTDIRKLRPETQIETRIHGQYQRLLEHISTHRWYLGEQHGAEIPYQEAVISWYDNVYLPLVNIIREQDVLEHFPSRTESDLYVWIITRQWYLRQIFGEGVSIEQATEQFLSEHRSEAGEDEQDEVE
jgi:hypothetical protein